MEKWYSSGHAAYRTLACVFASQNESNRRQYPTGQPLHHSNSHALVLSSPTRKLLTVENYSTTKQCSMFNENELLRLLLLLADTQVWLDDLGKKCLDYLHPPAKKLLPWCVSPRTRKKAAQLRMLRCPGAVFTHQKTAHRRKLFYNKTMQHV